MRIPMLAGLATVIGMAGCSRDLAIPPPNSLALDPSFTSVSPREEVLFTATGGAGGYTWDFATGGRLSGPDATIDVTGRYRAGRLGSALDVIVVTDVAGATRMATVSVGPRLSVIPALAGAAPGGSVTFVASGGQGPYAFSLAANASGGTIDPDTGAYVAGPVGDVVDEVLVSDFTGDPAATVVAQVRVSSAIKLYRGSASAVAPLEQTSFTAFGGQPPYSFTYLAGPPTRSGGSIQGSTGLYKAGPVGGTTDRIRVTDALAQVDELDVSVGPALALAPPAGSLRPGAPTRLLASGGRPPYTFSWVLLGNRSGGTVEPATGAYVPGFNTGALDVVQVTDAVGAVATLTLPAVGASVLEAGLAVDRCLAADVTGDGKDDALLIDFPTGSTVATLTSVSMPLGTAAVSTQGWLSATRAADRAIAVDFRATTGHDMLAFFGPAGFWTLVPDAMGNLTYGPSLPTATFWASPPADPTPIAAARVTGATRFYTGATCTVPSRGIVAFDWPDGAAAPSSSTTCVALNWTERPAFLWATDFDGDGLTDLVWIEYAAGMALAGTPVKMAKGTGDGVTFAPVTAFPFQDPTARMSLRDQDAALSAGALFLRVGSKLAVLRRGVGGGSPAWVSGTDWPYMPPTLVSFVSGVAVSDPVADRVVAWDSYGDFVGIEIAGATPTAGNVLPGTLPAMATCAAFPDLDGDGVTDAVVPVANRQDTLLAFGDGDGTFGSRFRFATDGRAALLGADVTGDGVADVAALTATPGIRVLASGSHQLAYGDERLAPSNMALIAGGRVGTGGTPGVALLDENHVLYQATVSNGSVGSPAKVPLSFWHGFTTTEALVVADLGSADPRDDVLIVTSQYRGGGAYDYIVDEVLSGSTPEYVLGPAMFGTQRRCAFLPVGTLDVAAVCTADGNAVTLGRSTRSGTTLPAFATTSTWTGIGGTRASMAAAGRLADGTALFVLSPSAPTGSAVTSTAVAVHPDFSVNATTLSGPTEPVTSAALGDVTGDGEPDLLVRAGTSLWVRAGAGGGAFSATGSRVGAAGTVVGVLAPTVTGAGDVLLSAESQLVVLVNDGAGTLH